MAISVVQKAGLGQGSASSSQSSGAFGSSTTAGNSIVGVAATTSSVTNGNRTVSSVSGQGTFSLAISAIYTNVNGGFGNIWIYLSPSVAGGSTTGVTFNLSGNVDDIDVGAMEVSGVNAVDQTNHHDNITIANGASTQNPNSITPSVANSLIVAVLSANNTITWGTEPTNYSNQFQDTGATFCATSIDTRVLSSSSAQNPTYNITENNASGGCALIVSFIQSGGGYVPQPLKIFNSSQMPMAPYSPSNPNVPMMAPPVGQKKIFLPTPKEVRKIAASRRKAA